MYKYRVFVSYSRGDEHLRASVVRRLEELGAQPLYDRNLKPGDPFSEVIRRFIAHAHVFIPILTPASAKRPWVLQEIGYGMALSIPLFPLAAGALPEGLASHLHAMELDANLTGIDEALTEDKIEHVVQSRAAPCDSIYQCAQTLIARTQLLVDYCKDIERLGFYGTVRQRSAFGSFTIPDSRPLSRVWDVREDGHPRTEQERMLLREERVQMETHARQEGCRLILDPEAVKCHSQEATAIRLETLRDTLLELPEDKTEVVFATGEIQTGLIIVGDWFVADAVVPMYGQSYQKTVFTRHGPTVIDAVTAFDREFDELKREAGTASREAAITRLDRLLKKNREE